MAIRSNSLFGMVSIAALRMLAAFHSMTNNAATVPQATAKVVTSKDE